MRTIHGWISIKCIVKPGLRLPMYIPNTSRDFSLEVSISESQASKLVHQGIMKLLETNGIFQQCLEIIKIVNKNSKIKLNGLTKKKQKSGGREKYFSSTAN